MPKTRTRTKNRWLRFDITTTFFNPICITSHYFSSTSRVCNFRKFWNFVNWNFFNNTVAFVYHHISKNRTEEYTLCSNRFCFICIRCVPRICYRTILLGTLPAAGLYTHINYFGNFRIVFRFHYKKIEVRVQQINLWLVRFVMVQVCWSSQIDPLLFRFAAANNQESNRETNLTDPYN